MSVIEHGTWIRYKPHEPFGKFKNTSGIVNLKREGDDQDWYAYIYGDDGPPFGTNSILMIAHDFTILQGTWVIGPATFDPTMLWPENGLLIELTGYTGYDPQADFGGKVYNRKDKTFSDLPPPPKSQLLTLEERVARLEQLLNNKLKEVK